MQTIDALRPALKALCQTLNGLGASYMIIGGVAVQARGVPRTTRDIDATVRGDQVTLAELTKGLARAGIKPRVRDFAALATQNFILLLEHRPTRTPIDLSLAWVDFERAACARATLERFGTVKVPVISLDDLLVLKTIAWRDRDQNDVRSLLSLNQPVDLAFVEAQVTAITEAMEGENRLPAFRKIVAQVRPRTEQPRRHRKRARR